MNPCAPANGQIRDMLQQIVGGIELIVYQFSLVLFDVGVNLSADNGL
jgi:hypothetical protein